MATVEVSAPTEVKQGNSYVDPTDPAVGGYAVTPSDATVLSPQPRCF